MALPIFQAVMKNDFETFKKLVEEGTNINIRGFDGITPLHQACLSKSLDIVKYIITHQGELNAQTNIFEETPLHLAVQIGKPEIVSELLDAGADPNYLNVERENCIYNAIRFDHSSLIPMLIDKKCDVNQLNLAGEVPLTIALLMNDKKAVSYLMDNEVNTDNPTIDQNKLKAIVNQASSNQSRPQTSQDFPETPLTISTAISPRKEKELTETLQRNGPHEVCSFFEIILSGTPEELQTFLSTPPSFGIDAKLFDNETALLTACEINSIEFVRILLEHDANPNVQTEYFQESPLHRAAENGNSDIITLLLEKGANINCQNIEGETPLFTLIRSGHSDLIPLFISNQADLNIINLGGATAIQIATLLHDSDAVFALKEKGANLSLGTTNTLQIALDSNEIDVAVAVREDAPELIETINSAPHSARMKADSTSLFKAIKQKNINELKKILASRIELNFEDEENGIPLMKTVELNSLPMTKMLIGAGANPDYITSNHPIPVLHMAIKSKFDQITDFLLTTGASVKIKNNENENAIFLAIRQNNLDLVKKLISYTIPLNVVNKNNLTPLYIAVGLKELPIIKSLLNAHADPNFNGLSCLKLAQDLHEVKIINVLITAGAKTQVKRPQHRSRQHADLLSKTMPLKNSKVKIVENQCAICKTTQGLVKLIPCGHVICCKKCTEVFFQRYSDCPLCERGYLATSIIPSLNQDINY